MLNIRRLKETSRLRSKGIYFRLKWRISNSRGFTLISRSERAFTLIELMVAISIVAILATIGLIAYSQTQKIARDSRRKQDLNSLRVALQLYYQDNKRYPCSKNYITSTADPSVFWLTNNSADDPGCSTNAFGSTYMNAQPIDPKSNGGDPTKTGQFGYEYQSGTQCAFAPGQYYYLITQLENANDQDRLGVQHTKDCNGLALDAEGWSVNSYVLTSQ